MVPSSAFYRYYYYYFVVAAAVCCTAHIYIKYMRLSTTTKFLGRTIINNDIMPIPRFSTPFAHRLCSSTNTSCNMCLIFIFIIIKVCFGIVSRSFFCCCCCCVVEETDRQKKVIYSFIRGWWPSGDSGYDDDDIISILLLDSHTKQQIKQYVCLLLPVCGR